MNMKEEKIIYVDDNYESIKTLFRLRAPSLLIGLILGFFISIVTSGFERVLSQNVQVAFFMPFVVYIADAIGTQTESIFSRNLKTSNAKFHTYLRKETVLGLIFGLVFGLLAGLVSFLWLHNKLLSMSVAFGTFLAVFTAPIIALVTTYLFHFFRKDPAAGSGPIATVIQDMTSVIIYGLVCSIILL